MGENRYGFGLYYFIVQIYYSNMLYDKIKKSTNDQQNPAKLDPHQSNNITKIGTKQNPQMNKKTQQNQIKPDKIKPTPIQQHHRNQNQIGTREIRTKLEPKSNPHHHASITRPTPLCLHHRTYQTAPPMKRNNLATPHRSSIKKPETSTPLLDPQPTPNKHHYSTTDVREKLGMLRERERGGREMRD